MITTIQSVNYPVRYGDPDYVPGRFYALEHASSTCRFTEHDTAITNARVLPEPLALERNGVQLVEHSTAITDFFDDDQIGGVYTYEVETLVRNLTGATNTFVYHWAARDEGPAQHAGRRPARNAHIDYTEESYRMWARERLGAAEADRLLQGRWSALNVWRGITPVESSPLAVCDASTVSDDDLIDVPIWLTPNQPHDPPVVGRNLKYNPRQKWYYFPVMQPNEALVFRLADTDHTRPRLAAHTAFDDPTTPDNAPARQSFEIRILAFFD